MDRPAVIPWVAGDQHPSPPGCSDLLDVMRRLLGILHVVLLASLFVQAIALAIALIAGP